MDKVRNKMNFRSKSVEKPVEEEGEKENVEHVEEIAS